MFALILLAAAVFFGTVSLPVSQIFFPHKVLLGAGFYNGVLIPTGLLLLAAMAAAPLLRWGAPPETRQVKVLVIAAVAGVMAAGSGWLGGLRHPLAMAVAGLAVTTVIGTCRILHPRRPPNDSTKSFWLDLLHAFRKRRRTYAGYVMHLGLGLLGRRRGGVFAGHATARGDALQGRVPPLGRARRPFRPPPSTARSPRNSSCRPSWK